MPRFPKAFGRRKSNANVLEDVPDVPAGEGTFKVFERADGVSKSFDGGVKFAKVKGNSARPKTSHLEDDNMFMNINNNRGSGASNTNTASTTDNSSRLSAASTTPSSTDVSGREEWRSPHDKPFSDIPVPPIPKSSSTFSLKNAGRTLSWGRTKPTPPSPPREETSPIEREPAAIRERAMTASSYASTATPPKLEKDIGLSMGGDFSDMFSGIGKRKSAVMESKDTRARSHSPEISRTSAQPRYNQPTALSIDKSRQVEASLPSWSSEHSNDGLMSNTSPPPFATRQQERAPPVPQHNTGYNRVQRPGALADTGLRRTSGYSGKRQSTIDSGEAVDEDALLLRESVNASRRLNSPDTHPQVRKSWALPSASSPPIEDTSASSWTTGSVQTTPKARKPVPMLNEHDDGLFDNHLAASANIAQRFQEESLYPPPARNAAPQNKVMTPAQFERYKQDQERLRSVGGQSRDEEEEEEDETYDDEEDEAEKNKQLAKQRRKQEAHMVVYRQQMMKVTGETSSGPPAATRPSVFATQSSPNLGLSGKSSSDDNEEEDEEVPLGILQAHGFPNKSKPPRIGSNPNLRASAQSLAGNPADPRLPVFARHLPQDPYFGASVVNPMNRESFGFGGGGGPGSVAGSVSGGPSRGLQPGGLVGVIATEERSRAMRRGSPNPQGEYGPPSNGFNGMGGMGMPPNGMMPGQMGQMGPGNPMMMTPGDQAQIQMSQQMQQFMQMQMQFMQMMTSGQGQGQGPPQQNGHVSQPSMGSMPQSNSPHLRPTSSHQRAMTMLDPNAAPWMQNGHGSLYAPSMNGQGGYAPSIAPSERSNIGLPGRYRPVTHTPAADNKSRTSTMTGALQGWENKNSTATIKAVKKSGNEEDEDDEEGWEEMKKKREKKKSIWRTKKGESTNGLKEMLGYT
ncbi:hypothetical protein LHYA1_G007315 [Lachnellula hyalina]|uniref:Uncharacterized protein n=1 Tax=Lachnellula hyalina TaxID=1316788 RepID=A0A8H8QVD1_9HELO|nr:uncharacterized protein LHYA1_G007315 [Lachnellula hyalina]TVY23503.1 hypothetical protein LHYA1_G007315 [Lachnellula hyalina]